jgi:hypothetical protein
MPDLALKLAKLASQVENPRLAICEIRFLDDGATNTVTIALHNSIGDDDDGIFFYAGSISGLISLMQAGVEDFVITDVLSIE